MRVEEVEEEEEPTTPVVSCFSVMSDTIQPLGQPLGIEFELNRSGKSGMSNTCDCKDLLSFMSWHNR